MKILVTGSEGMLGRAVLERFGAAHEIVGIDLADGDLSDGPSAAGLCERTDPDWIIHCAAWTDVDGAESQPEQAQAANADATGNLARWSAGRGCGLTLMSTDYVFQGQTLGGGYDEGDVRDPINAYGRTKAAAEEQVEALETPWQIVRTSWLFGDGPVHFPRTILRLLSERESLKVVRDQEGCPTYAADLAAVLEFLVTRRAEGIFHATNAGACTWYDLAREVAALGGYDPDRIRSCSSDAFPRPARRPACSVLRSRRLQEAGCPEPSSWRDALARYLVLLTSGEARYP